MHARQVLDARLLVPGDCLRLNGRALVVVRRWDTFVECASPDHPRRIEQIPEWQLAKAILVETHEAREWRLRGQD